MEKQTMTIYLSLPISGYDIEERRDTALQMEVRLRGLGFHVLNPLSSEWWEDGHTTQEYMQADIRLLLDADAIFLMDGWNRSAGCKCELDVAVACGKLVYFENAVNLL